MMISQITNSPTMILSKADRQCKAGLIVLRHLGLTGNTSVRYLHQASTTSCSSGKANKKFSTLNKETPYNLCFLRHGQSTWNRDITICSETEYLDSACCAVYKPSIV